MERKKHTKEVKRGYVYILSNQAMPGLVKIGRTRNVEQRMRGLYKTGVPSEFKEEYSILVKDPIALENAVHRHLQKVRYNDGREFFRVSIQEAIKHVKILAGEKDEPIERNQRTIQPQLPTKKD